MGFPEGAWHESGEGAVQAAEDMVPQTDRYEIEITKEVMSRERIEI